MSINELIEGEIYVTSYSGQGDYIFKQKLPNDSKKWTLNKNSFNQSSGIHDNNGFYVYRHPTFEELKHFKACENANKWVPCPKEIELQICIW